MADHYCNLDDVNKLVPQQPFDEASVPSGALVEQLIVDIAQEIDSVLGNLGFTVPVVTGPVALNQLRRANAWGVLGLAQDSRMTAVLRDDMVGGSKNVWTARYETWKKNLQDPKNPYTLTDAQTTNLAVVKPLGSLQSSTVNQTQMPDGSSYDYLSKPPFYIGMKR